ncbi:MAG TPA: bifunctional DNA primase/polymerase, partial [Symbiobacteriaceae bacterium]|nr:bifunctional DNA primase/polymerase [Symbiobacteriaceae bacterium]
MAVKKERPAERGRASGTFSLSSILSLTKFDNTTLQAALTYIERGWAVIPLAPRDKVPYNPLLPKDREGKPCWKYLTVDPARPAEVVRWFKQRPDINIGILTGSPSGNLVVRDIDRPPVVPLHLPITPAVATGRGSHYYYQSSEPLPGRKYHWGELKAEGGYVVAPPSIHPSGVAYEWADYCSPAEVELAEVPADLLEPEHLSIRGNVMQTHSLGDTASKEAGDSPLLPWVQREDVARAVLRLCGVTAKTGKAFQCVLPGHQEHRPSAAVYQHPSGQFMYHDFHGKGADWYTLAEVYHAVKTGKTRKLSPGENAVWLLKALRETGFVKAPAIMAPALPNGVKPIIMDAYAGFRELLALRTIYDSAQTAAPYSWSFAAEWIGRSERRTGEAVAWLLEAGYLVKAGQVPGRRPMALYL